MLDLTTPSLLFSAISLILLAYTNRFLSYASVVRTLKEKHQQTHDPKDIAQIANLRKRLYLTRSMQILGILSLLLCVISMLSIFHGKSLPPGYSVSHCCYWPLPYAYVSGK